MHEGRCCEPMPPAILTPRKSKVAALDAPVDGVVEEMEQPAANKEIQMGGAPVTKDGSDGLFTKKSLHVTRAKGLLGSFNDGAIFHAALGDGDHPAR